MLHSTAPHPTQRAHRLLCRCEIRDRPTLQLSGPQRSWPVEYGWSFSKMSKVPGKVSLGTKFKQPVRLSSARTNPSAGIDSAPCHRAFCKMRKLDAYVPCDLECRNCRSVLNRQAQQALRLLRSHAVLDLMCLMRITPLSLVVCTRTTKTKSIRKESFAQRLFVHTAQDVQQQMMQQSSVRLRLCQTKGEGLLEMMKVFCLGNPTRQHVLVSDCVWCMTLLAAGVMWSVVILLLQGIAIWTTFGSMSADKLCHLSKILGLPPCCRLYPCIKTLQYQAACFLSSGLICSD